jgi:hypothetical protein
MGHNTGFQHDVALGLERTKILIDNFNKLSINFHDGIVRAYLEDLSNHSGNTIIMRNTRSHDFVKVDPKIRLNIKGFKSGIMIKTRDSKMTREERIAFIKDRVILIVLVSRITFTPINFNIASLHKLMEINAVKIKPPISNPTAIMISLASFPPIRAWHGGARGFGLTDEKDVIESFVQTIKEVNEKCRS